MSSHRMKKKRMKIKIVLCICTSDKNWEGKNVKFHINYRYKSNLYALFTCFVFRYYIVRHSISKWTLAQNPTYISPSTTFFHRTICLCCAIISHSQFFFTSTFSVWFFYFFFTHSPAAHRTMISIIFCYIWGPFFVLSLLFFGFP